MGTDNNRLDRSKLLESLAMAATSSEPSNILLAGPWGSGKTALLNELRKEMESCSGDNAPHVIWFSPWNTVADGDPRMAFFRLLRNELKPVSVSNPRAKLWISKIDKALQSKLMSRITSLIPGGILLSVAGEVTSLVNELLKTGEKDDSILALRKEISSLLKSIADAKGKKRILLLVDDLDRARPEEAVAVLDSLYHLFMPHSGEEEANDTWPLTSIWAVNTAVLEEYLYREYRELPSFDPNAYLEKLFRQRINVPPLIEGEKQGDTTRLWKGELKKWSKDDLPCTMDDLACTLSTYVNYAILGNLRLHARVRRDCVRLWSVMDKKPKSKEAFIRDARLIVLIDAFPYFREQIAPFDGMWPHFVNQVNKRITDRPMEWVANPLYRHVDSPDLATLLVDLHALRYIDDRMCYEIDTEGRRRLQQNLNALWEYGI